MVRYVVIPIVVICVSGCSMFGYEWRRGEAPPEGHILGFIEGCKLEGGGDIWKMRLEEVEYICEWSDEQVNEWFRKQ